LNKYIEKLESDINSCTKKAKEYVINKQQPSALVYIKKKRKLESLLHNKQGALSNLSEIIISIESTFTNKEILDAYTAGNQILKVINKNLGLSAGAIDDQVLNMIENLADLREIDIALKQGSDEITGTIDENELEEELSTLLAEKPSFEYNNSIPEKQHTVVENIEVVFPTIPEVEISKSTTSTDKISTDKKRLICE